MYPPARNVTTHLCGISRARLARRNRPCAHISTRGRKATVAATTDSAQQESGTGASPDYVRHNARPLSTHPLDGTFLSPD